MLVLNQLLMPVPSPPFSQPDWRITASLSGVVVTATSTFHHFDTETSQNQAGSNKTKRSSSRGHFSLFKNERSSATEARTKTRGPCFRDGFLLAKANTTAANTRSRRKQPKRSTSSVSSFPVVSTSTSTSAGPASPPTLPKGQLCLYGCRASAEDDLFFKGSGGTEFVRIVGEWPWSLGQVWKEWSESGKLVKNHIKLIPIGDPIYATGAMMRIASTGAPNQWIRRDVGSTYDATHALKPLAGAYPSNLSNSDAR